MKFYFHRLSNKLSSWSFPSQSNWWTLPSFPLPIEILKKTSPSQRVTVTNLIPVQQTAWPHRLYRDLHKMQPICSSAVWCEPVTFCQVLSTIWANLGIYPVDRWKGQQTNRINLLTEGDNLSRWLGDRKGIRPLKKLGDVSYTVSVHVGCPKILGMLGPTLLTGWGAWLTPRNTQLPHRCYHTKFCRSRSNRSRVCRGPGVTKNLGDNGAHPLGMGK